MPEEQFVNRWTDAGRRGGSEHQVYFDEGSHLWIKRNILNFHDGSNSAYLERLAAHKLAFPDAAPELLGFTNSGSELFPLIKQADVQGAIPTEAAIDSALASIGFLPIQESGEGMKKAHALAIEAGLRPPPLAVGRRVGYYLRAEGIWLEDVHEENARVAPNGELRVFDPVMYYVGEI